MVIMELKKVLVKNYRLLKQIEVRLDSGVNLILGRNNSGKTSLTEIFYMIFSNKHLDIEDFSLESIKGFEEACKLKKAGGEKDDVRSLLPMVTMRLEFEYDIELGDLGVASHFIIDLNPESNKILVELNYAALEGSVDNFFDGFEDIEGEETIKRARRFYKYTKAKIKDCYSWNIHAVDPDNETNKKVVTISQLGNILQADFVNAQRPLDGDSNQEKNALGRIFGTLFDPATDERGTEKDKEAIRTLNDALAEVEEGVNDSFHTALDTLLPTLGLFGYPSLNDTPLSTETSFEAASLMKDKTSIVYTAIDGLNLPERQNGLGTRNLIYMLFKLYEAFKRYQILSKRPSTNLVFIEEPEAHLHPQMQEVFIQQLIEVKALFEKTYNNGKVWPVQFIVTTHSAHVTSRAKLEWIRYFLVKKSGENKATQVKDIRDGLGGDGITEPEVKFLMQYLELTKSDLFFADKAILVEGASERIMLPKMSPKVSKKLVSQYVSTVEVGGAYAHIFFDLLKFLELKTLVITDLDSVGEDTKKCKVAQGTKTSNTCIKKWFSDEESITPKWLIERVDTQKIRDNIRICYQVPEGTDIWQSCGRSFEEAFIRANRALFPEGDEYDIAKKESASKSSFALRFATSDDDWSVPKYIQDGLKWLEENPVDQVVEEVKINA
jgi:putative ATP-dependent endonuclease of OLD family